MPTLSRRRILETLEACAKEKSAQARGRALEELTTYIFARCDGIRHWKNNVLNAAGSSEIDVCFWNNRSRDSLDFFPRGLLVVECKNTNKRVASPSIRVFRTKLVDMGLRYGILIAANGITGDPRKLTAAHDAIRTAYLVERVRIIVITRSEFEGLTDTVELVRLLQDKIMALTLQAQTFTV